MRAGHTSIPWLRIGAESLAIVVSILLAFAIDAWYDRKVDQRLEADYTRRIADELEVIRSALEREEGNVRQSAVYSSYAADLFESGAETIDPDQVIAALYYFGLDSLQIFDLSAYEDLISSGRLGLISDLERRASIQRAYLLVRRVEEYLAPFRSQYLSAVRGWIPQSIITKLRSACPGRMGFDCESVDLGDVEVAAIIEQVASNEARLAFQLRQQGLASLEGILDQASVAVDQALATLK